MTHLYNVLRRGLEEIRTHYEAPETSTLKTSHPEPVGGWLAHGERIAQTMHSLMRDTMLAASPGRVLELGCAGRDLQEWIESLGHTYMGVDIERRGRGPTLIADSADLPFADDTFDVVLACAMLHHVEDPAIVLAEAFRVLKPGGRMIANWAYVYGVTDNGSYFHASASGIERILLDTGLTSIECEVEWPYWESVADMAFQGPGGYAWKFLCRHLLRGLEYSFVCASSIARLIKNRPALDMTRRAFDTAGSIAFTARKPQSDLEITRV